MSKKKYVSNEISKLHNVDEIENLVKSMKNYIANDYTDDDSITDWNSPLKVAHPLGYVYPY